METAERNLMNEIMKISNEQAIASRDLKTVFNKIDDLNNLSKKLDDLNTNLTKIDVKVNNIEKNLEASRRNSEAEHGDHEQRLRALESKPSKRWESIISGLIGVVSGILGSLIFKK